LGGVWAIAGVVVATVAAPAFNATVDADAVGHWTKPLHGRAQAFEFLVRSAWTEGEAQERGVGADVPKDLKYRARIELLRTEIEAQVTQPAAESVTPADIDAYVHEHPRTEPERRKVRVVRTRSAATARRVLRKLGSGMTWRLAQHHYGLDSGSTMELVEPGTYPRRPEAAMFAAEVGQISRYGAYVFKVVSIAPEHLAAMNVQRAAAWEVLASEREQQALDQFRNDFDAKWRARTTCAPQFTAPSLCGNAAA
jgi:hypothetical protein